MSPILSVISNVIIIKVIKCIVLVSNKLQSFNDDAKKRHLTMTPVGFRFFDTASALITRPPSFPFYYKAPFINFEQSI
jgi:hypothetical protein